MGARSTPAIAAASPTSAATRKDWLSNRISAAATVTQSVTITGKNSRYLRLSVATKCRIWGRSPEGEGWQTDPPTTLSKGLRCLKPPSAGEQLFSAHFPPTRR